MSDLSTMSEEMFSRACSYEETRGTHDSIHWLKIVFVTPSGRYISQASTTADDVARNGKKAIEELRQQVRDQAVTAFMLANLPLHKRWERERIERDFRLWCEKNKKSRDDVLYDLMSHCLRKNIMVLSDLRPEDKGELDRSAEELGIASDELAKQLLTQSMKDRRAARRLRRKRGE